MYLRRTLQPHDVAVRDPERREERREGVADERRVEVGEVARARDDEAARMAVAAIPQSVGRSRLSRRSTEQV
jgi:hypothetical protein